MKVPLLLGLSIVLGAAAAPPAEVQTGRSVAVERPQQYWLSNDLNRLFLQKPAQGEAPRDDKAIR